MLYIFIGQNLDYRELLQIGVLIKKVNENIGNRRNLQESYYCRNLKKTVCKQVKQKESTFTTLINEYCPYINP